MSRIERVIVQTAGVIEEPRQIDDFPGFVEDLVAQGRGFPIFQRVPEPDPESDDFPPRIRPIIGFSGRGTLPLISDPDQMVSGAFAIDGSRLVYDTQATPVHQLRDSYRWSFVPWYYFIDEGFEDVVRSFEEAGYPIFMSLDHWRFMKGWGNMEGFVIGEQTSLERIRRGIGGE